MGILDEIEQEQVKNTLAGSMLDGMEQLKTMVKIERFGLYSNIGFIILAFIIGGWILPFAPVVAPFTFIGTLSGAGGKLTNEARKKLWIIVYAKGLQTASVLMVALMITCWFLGFNLNHTAGDIGAFGTAGILLFMIYRNVSVGKNFKKLIKIMQEQHSNIA
ncbi:hypothetical protein A6M27_11425 [Acidithiobacillus thiooxidans]|uniref:Uncharacterized protein n=1 Tax=Acidithiobacillus thiooxidans TaxID=930 RepID=A0A1C2JFE0_ACITH|nr:hypothetical protein [Acidithiobacillus thiooxidans]OCX69496.1 hypothetical protein A6O24_18340 [Acidithiobacillus thiooxidans]OCX71705.1 hypothetical protein A6P07_11535 [Acidithiobacillus thiooxidans]OCX77809.1 hypothetical protein A6O26_19295 [Acidithiobacillus thiooxidans]OCX86904.1 hypothetical protein A6M27_11425 [Acidithiobacillus thiooxidans]OFC49633.1 hypothetical protein BAE47_04735 [Acidithiobacillus thiooxidans]